MSAARFAAFLKERAPDVTAFSAQELFMKGGSNANLRLNTDPPESLWPNILPALRALQALRTRLGKPIILNSVYRSPAYNSAIGGAAQSAHMDFRAIDFHVVDEKSGPADWISTLRAMRSAGGFTGGLGAYETFCHIDSRSVNTDFDQIDASAGRVLPPVGTRIPVGDAEPRPVPRPPASTVGQGAGGLVGTGGAGMTGAGLESGNGWLIAGGLILLVVGAFLFLKSRGK